ncbi:AsmA family protein, partial [bacterium]|nr:AsmA family protein [bacterium]
MLNRLYIVIGALAIFILAAGFVAPQFIDWTSYRARLETLVETNLGTDVTIAGDFSFSLLPQPVMKIGQTFIGPVDQPFLEIGNLEAEFSLMDFLRDRFIVTGLQIGAPKINLDLREDGSFELPFDLPEETSATNVSIASADILDGQVVLSDRRTGETYTAQNIDGTVRISGISGPFSLQGQLEFEQRAYSTRMALSALNDARQSNLTFVLSPTDASFLMTVEALANLSASPSIDGSLALRIEREQSDTALGAQGDLIMVSEIKADAAQVSLPAFTLQPDENRPATRLTGAVSILLGAAPSFDAVLSGGVVGLAPRDVLDDEQEKPYPVIELLAGLPAPMVPPIPGRLGVDVAELDLQVFALRNVRLDAHADENGWQVDEFLGQLAGSTQLSLAGRFDNVQGLPSFDGTLDMQTRRMDALGRLWGAGENSVLFDVPTRVTADLSFADTSLGLANGQLEIDGGLHSFAGLFGVGDERSALLSARFSALDDLDSEILSAIIPPLDAGSDIWRSFPSGSIDVASERAVLFDVAGEGLAAQLDWADGALNIERLSARNWGGAQVDFKGQALGTVLDSNISGAGFLRFADSDNAELLSALLAAQGANETIEELAFANLPLEFNFTVAPKSENGEQTISALGRIGVADVALDASLSSGLFGLSTAPLQVSASFSSAEPDLFAQQLGLQFTPLSVDARTNVQLFLEGTASNSFQLTMSAEGGDDYLAYGGSLNISDPTVWSGKGRIDFGLSEPNAVFGLLGVDLPYISAASGSGEVIFTGVDAIALNDLQITDDTGKSLASGQFSLSQTASTRLAVGQVAIAELDHSDVWAMLFGPVALLEGENVFPDGPIDIGSSRQSRALIDISVDRIFRNDAILARNFSANLSVNDDGTDLRNISAELGAGSVEGSISVCCANL